MTQFDLARKTQISRSMISHYELNLKTAKYSNAIRIAEVLDVPLEYLLSGGNGESASGTPVSKVKIPIEISEQKVKFSLDGKLLTDQEISSAISYIREERSRMG